MFYKPWFDDCISFDLERNILVTCAFDALGLYERGNVNVQI